MTTPIPDEVLIEALRRETQGLLPYGFTVETVRGDQLEIREGGERRAVLTFVAGGVVERERLVKGNPALGVFHTIVEATAIYRTLDGKVPVALPAAQERNAACAVFGHVAPRGMWRPDTRCVVCRVGLDADGEEIERTEGANR